MPANPRRATICGLFPYVSRLHLTEWAHEDRPTTTAAPPPSLTSPYWTVEAVAVSPAHQGQGTGKALITHALHLSSQDPTSTGLYILTGDQPNRVLYEGWGFSLVEERQTADLTSYHLFRKRSTSDLVAARLRVKECRPRSPVMGRIRRKGVRYGPDKGMALVEAWCASGDAITAGVVSSNGSFAKSPGILGQTAVPRWKGPGGVRSDPS